MIETILALLAGLVIGYLVAKNISTAELAAVKQREETLKQQNDTLQEQLKLWFENTATRVLQSTAQQSQSQLDAILSPVKERLEGFQKKVEEVYGKEAEQRIMLKAQIDQLHQTNKALGADADNLARALKGDSQKRGQWGEMILDNVLAASGLREGVDYTSQGRGLGLTGEAGERQKPDVIVNMSGGQHVIVDSKVSLVAYTNWIALAPDAPEQKQARAAFVESVKSHIKDLSGKKYQDNGKLIAHDYVLMFMPIESALASALDFDPELANFAWSKRVALVSPTTLLLTLSAINATLQMERQERHAESIATDAANLYDQLRLVVESLNDVDKHLTNARKSHEEAIKRLSDGRGNVLGRVESFRTRGISVKKPIALPKLEGQDIPALVDDAS